MTARWGLLILVMGLAGCVVVEGPVSIWPSVEAHDTGWWVDHHIMYRSDMEGYGYREYWASPEETLESRYGDCEDMVILWLRIIYENTGLKGYLETWELADGTYHAVGRLEGLEYGYIEGGKLIHSRYYDSVMDNIGWRFSTRRLGE